MKQRMISIMLILSFILSVNYASDSFALGETMLSISAGTAHSSAVLSNGSVKTWGLNQSGQLGNESTNDSVWSVTVGLEDVRYVSCGVNHTMAIKNDYTLWAWGGNESGQLGIGESSYEPVTKPVMVMSAVSQVAAGDRFTAIIKNDGTLWTTGLNDSGQLGNGSRTDVSSFSQVMANGRYMNEVASVSVGMGYMLIVKYDGSLWVCGSNTYSQLGTGDNNMKTEPVQVNGLSNIQSASAGVRHSAAVTFDGKLYTWGENTYGQLGDGLQSNRSTPVLIDTSGAAMAAVGFSNTYVVYSNGEMKACGSAAFLGKEENTTQKNLVSVLDGVKSISVGFGENIEESHVLALTDKNELFSWGSNTNGQLGNGSRNKRSAPTGIPVVSNVLIPPELYGGYNFILPFDGIKNINSIQDLTSQMNRVIESLSEKERQDPNIQEEIILFAELAVSWYSKLSVSDGTVQITKSFFDDRNTNGALSLSASAELGITEIEKILNKAGISKNREIRRMSRVSIDNQGSLEVVIFLSAADIDLSGFFIDYKGCSVYLSKNSVEKNTASGIPLTIRISEVEYPTNSYLIRFSPVMSEEVTIYLPAQKGDVRRQVIVEEEENTAGVCKYIPGLQKISTMIKKSGVYGIIQTTSKHFEDISECDIETQAAIQLMVRQGITSGTDPEGKQFSPKANVSRAQMSTFITRLLSEYDESAVCSFDDVAPGNWYYRWVASANTAGLMSGSGGTFKPNDNIDKVQILAVISNALQEYMNYSIPNSQQISQLTGTFSDSGTIPDWARVHVAIAVKAGIIAPSEVRGKLSPNQPITREEMAVYINRLYDRIWL